MAVKDVSLDGILGLPEDRIRHRFPHGAALGENGRWRAVTEDYDGEAEYRTLAELLRMKERRMQKPHMLHKNSEHGYTTDPAMAMRPDAGEAPPEDFQIRMSTDAHLRAAIRQREDLERLAREDHKRLSARAKSYVIRAARRGIDPMPTLAAIERVLVQAENDLDQVAA